MRRAWPWLGALALTALGAAAGAAYSELGPRTYTATAQLIVSPLPASDTTFTGIAVFRDSGGRRTAAQSADYDGAIPASFDRLVEETFAELE